MDYNRRRKAKKWFNKYKVPLIATGSFVIVGLIAGLIGFEIANDWHAIRDWIKSPWATTFFICLVIGLFALGILVMALLNIRRGND